MAELPKIPGQIYRTSEPRWVRVILFSFMFLFLLWSHSLGEIPLWLLIVFFIVALTNILLSAQTKYTNVTETTVSAELENGDRIHEDPLENYVLYIKEGLRTGGSSLSKNYKYGVSLLPKDKLAGYHEVENLIFIPPDSIDQTDITLANRILCPRTLKEWVHSFQEQVEEPIQIVFQSSKIKDDYDTGVFRNTKSFKANEYE